MEHVEPVHVHNGRVDT